MSANTNVLCEPTLIKYNVMEYGWKDPIILGVIAGSGKFVLEFSTDDINNREARLSFQKIDFIFNKSFDCKLIARHISSMGDEELSECEDLWHDIVYGPLGERNEIISAIDALERISVKEVDVFLYLLSIGVLPESLADDDVIWRGNE